MGRSQGAYGRIISACAEQTPRGSAGRWTNRDHLRVCGADVLGERALLLDPGSSPRVRSRQRPRLSARHDRGIISACAEQTQFGKPVRSGHGDHLRVCGADVGTLVTLEWPAGSSPRVRSRPCYRACTPAIPGIISACAEQTYGAWPTGDAYGDHLRVCGADLMTLKGHTDELGSSPRVRSRRPAEHHRIRPQRIISACAEQTIILEAYVLGDGDHLRVCGADPATHLTPNRTRGSSPRVRSRP